MNHQDDVRRTLGRDLDALRRRSGTRMADAGLPKSTLVTIESGEGRARVGQVRTLCDAYGGDMLRLPIMTGKPDAKYVAIAREAAADIPIEHIITLAWAQGRPAARVLKALTGG